jgi:hypothetical protein
MTDKFGPGKIRDGRLDPRSAKAIARRKELREEDGAEIKRISDRLLMTLREPATIEQELRAGLIARTAVKITRLAERRRESLGERQLLENLLRVPFNVETNIVGAKRSPEQTYFTVEKGDDFAPGVATAPDEVSNNAG